MRYIFSWLTLFLWCELMLFSIAGVSVSPTQEEAHATVNTTTTFVVTQEQTYKSLPTMLEKIHYKLTEKIIKDNRVKELAMDLIKEHEGYSSTPYKDHLGNWIIGYGELIVCMKGKMRTNEFKAEQKLISKIEEQIQHLDEYLPWWRKLDANRQAALIDFTYNLGIDKVMTFKNMLTSLEKGNYKKASKHLMNSRYAKQVTTRAKTIKQIFTTGRHPVTFA